MNRSIGIGCLAVLVAALPAGGLAASLAASLPPPAPTATASIVTQSTPSMPAPDLYPFVLLLLGFAFLTIAMLLFYIYRAQRVFYSTAERLGRIGRSPTSVLVPATVMRYGV